MPHTFHRRQRHSIASSLLAALQVLMVASQAHLIKRFEWWSKIASTLVVLFAGSVLVGWYLEPNWQVQYFPDFPPMKYNTALGFVLSSLTILLLYHIHPPQHRQYIAQLGGILVLLIGAITLTEMIFDRSLGIDELFFDDPNSNGRMAPLSALFFVLMGIALILMNDQPGLIVQGSATLALITAGLGILESVYALSIRYNVSTFSAVPPVTMLCYVLVTTSLLGYRLEQSRVQAIVTDSIRGLVLRRLLIGTPILLLGFNGMIFAGHHMEWFPATTAYALSTISIGAVIAAQAWHMAFVIGQVEDERNAAHAALTERELLYRTLFEGMEDAVIVHDLQGKLIEVNDSAVRRLGYSRDELLQMSTHQIDEPDFGGKFEERIAEQMRYGRLENILGTHISKSGKRIPIQVSTRVTTFKGQPAVVSVVHDISLLQKVQQDELELAMERARSQILTKFVQDASHEFRTPLAIIMMGLDSLARTDDAERRLKLIQRGEEQVARITRLVEQLVLITELDDPTSYHFKPVSMAQVLKALQERYGGTEQEFRTILYEIETPEIKVSADIGRLSVALSQILDNAVRYSAHDSAVRVCATVNGAYMVISIRDEGIGIAATDIDQIFMRFYRKDTAHTTEGFGLGLPIAKIIIKAHKGAIEVESKPGHGTTFRVLLPMIEPQSTPQV